MRLYLECRMGASGDMLMAALYELLPDKSAFRERMKRLDLPGVTFEYSTATKCGITGTHIAVRVGGAEEKSEDVHDHNTTHGRVHDSTGATTHRHGGTESQHGGENHRHSGHRYGYKDMLGLIGRLGLPDNIRDDALGVYNIIGEAEAAVHGVPLDKIHLHEIGALDAVADIVGCCTLINMLGVTEIIASPIHVGAGSVQCEHGILPIPAPAAAEILKGIPIYGGSIIGELCTPTGAALLKRFVKRFGEMPPMAVAKIGCGMGAKDFKAANCLRAFLCEEEILDGGDFDSVFEISCNLDDMTPEAVGAAFELLFDNGALDVYTTPIMMKKNRPAVKLSCLCTEESRDKLSRMMLEHTTTLGVRISLCNRRVLTRATETVSTEYGEIRVKRAYGFGVTKFKPEHDDVLAASKRHGVPFTTVRDAAMTMLLSFYPR